jgi:hypothetical protein
VRRTYFCEQAGLVCLDDASSGREDAEHQEVKSSESGVTRKLLIGSVVSKVDLAKLRGGRKEETRDVLQSQCDDQCRFAHVQNASNNVHVDVCDDAAGEIYLAVPSVAL